MFTYSENWKSSLMHHLKTKKETLALLKEKQENILIGKLGNLPELTLGAFYDSPLLC